MAAAGHPEWIFRAQADPEFEPAAQLTMCPKMREKRTAWYGWQMRELACEHGDQSLYYEALRAAPVSVEERARGSVAEDV